MGIHTTRKKEKKMIGFGADSNSKKQFKYKINQDEMNKIIKDYKKIKKYMKSPIFSVKTMDGTESYVSSLIKESQEDPVD
jgi:hypothetical protein